MSITIYDIFFLIILGIGVWEGRKKGFYRMITPLLSFFISIFLMKYVSNFVMDIFGDDLMTFFANQLDKLTRTLQFTVEDLQLIENIKRDFMYKFVQGIVFVLSYAAINTAVTFLFNKLRRISNNMVIYRLDQVLGSIAGALSNGFFILLVITVVQILCDMNITDVMAVEEKMQSSTALNWLMEHNYLYTLIGRL